MSLYYILSLLHLTVSVHLFASQPMVWYAVFLAMMTIPAMGSFKVNTGNAVSCALENGHTKCWGYNNHGQLGLGHTGDVLAPLDDPRDWGTDRSGNEFMVESLECGDAFCCALSREQSVKCYVLKLPFVRL